MAGYFASRAITDILNSTFSEKLTIVNYRDHYTKVDCLNQLEFTLNLVSVSNFLAITGPSYLPQDNCHII